MNPKLAGAALVLSLMLSACGKSDTPASAAAASASSGPSVSVSTVVAQQRDYPVQLEATGTVTPLSLVEVKPQVSSTVTKVHIREGQFVQAGQLLFTLDARGADTDVAKAQAQLQKDLAALADAQRQLQRSQELLAQNFVSQVAVDQARTLVDSAQAVAAADRAALQATKVSLSYNRIVATSAGRAGIINVYPGTLVQPTSPALVTITQLDPIAVTFNLPQRNLGDALQSLRDGGGRVDAVLPEGRGTLKGKLAFVDNTVDANSGTVKVRALFANKDETLWPGAFVNVRLAVQTLRGAIVVPQASIVQGERGRVVFVVDSGNKAAMRPVEVVYSAGTDAVVTGVQAGDRVVVDGRQNLRPGVTVIERVAEGASAPRRGTAGSAPVALSARGGPP